MRIGPAIRKGNGQNKGIPCKVKASAIKCPLYPKRNPKTRNRAKKESTMLMKIKNVMLCNIPRCRALHCTGRKIKILPNVEYLLSTSGSKEAIKIVIVNVNASEAKDKNKRERNAPRIKCVRNSMSFVNVPALVKVQEDLQKLKTAQKTLDSEKAYSA